MPIRRFAPSGPITLYRLTVAPPIVVSFPSASYRLDFTFDSPSGRHELKAHNSGEGGWWSIGPVYRSFEALSEAALVAGLPIQRDTVAGTIMGRLEADGRAINIDREKN